MFPSELSPEYKHLLGIRHTEERDGQRLHHLDVRFVRSGFVGVEGLPTLAILDDILYHNSQALVPIPVYNQGEFAAKHDVPAAELPFNYFFIGTNYSPSLMVLKNVKYFFDHPHHTPFLSLMPNNPHDPSILVREEGMLHENTYLDAVVSGMVEEYQQAHTSQRIGSSHLFMR